MKNIST